jgi:hypothetical protein
MPTEQRPPVKTTYSGPTIALVGLVVLSLVGYAAVIFLANKTLHWTEDVVLHDGSGLLVERSEKWQYQLGLGDNVGWGSPHEVTLRVTDDPKGAIGAEYNRVRRQSHLSTVRANSFSLPEGKGMGAMQLGSAGSSKPRACLCDQQ